MISSAVVIPEQDPEQRTPSPSLKRRQSSISPDSNKRPRLDVRNGSDHGSQPNTGDAMSPPGRKRSALGVGAAEEKKRGQRLFGALLGTLSQTSSKPAHKKRDEIEQRQRERLRKDTEEREEERRRKREELDELRRTEQKAWEKESVRIRHRNMRATAGFLQTRTEPRLYYKPWELREKEEEQIRQQVREVDEKIRLELGEVAAEEASGMENTGKSAQNDIEMSPSSSNGRNRRSSLDEKAGGGHGDDHHDDDGADEMSVEKPSNIEKSTPDRKAPEEDRPKDDDHAGEELVEGQEDDVIY